MFVANRGVARVRPLQARDANLQPGRVGIWRGLDELFAAWNAAREDDGIDERGVDGVAPGRQRPGDRDLHARRSARSIARRAFTRARCARNSADAWMSASGSTPSAACSAAAAIALAGNEPR